LLSANTFGKLFLSQFGLSAKVMNLLGNVGVERLRFNSFGQFRVRGKLCANDVPKIPCS